ncbi:MAG: phenylacetate-CoA oxygenase subunit PaaI, partial [Halobacteriales archaeon]
MSSDAQFKEELQNGRVVESVDEMTEGYKKALKQILLVSGDTELMSAPSYYEQSLNAPTMNAR